MSELKPIGFIVEQKNIYSGRKRKIESWKRFSTKLYRTKEIAEDAYEQSPYKNWEGYNVTGRIIPVYRQENELPILIKNLKL